MPAVTAAPRWNRLGADVRREQILAAAARLFGERPYSAISTTELAEAAGVTRGLLHHYFGTKRELYLEVLRSMMYVPPLEDLQVPEGSREERIEHAVNWFMAFITSHGRTWLALLSADSAGSDPEVAAILREADDLAASRVLEALEFSGTAKQRRVAMTAIRSFGSMSKAMGRELVREAISRAEAKRVLVAALTATLDSVGV